MRLQNDLSITGRCAKNDAYGQSADAILAWRGIMFARGELLCPSSLIGAIALRLTMATALIAAMMISVSDHANAQVLPPENRIALLIANAKYRDNVGPLVNPPRDVETLKKSLENIGFKVAVAHDLGLVPMRRAVSEYAKRLREAGPGTVGFFYYSGHGAAESDLGPNYLIPVDAELATGDDLSIASERLESLVDTLGSVSNNVMQFVVFDACRSVLRRPGRGGTKGFVPIDQRRGMVIVFSTAAREVAFDEWPRGSDRGPFAAKLAELMISSPKREDGMITDLQNAVHTFTQGRQEPFVIRSSVRDFFFNPKATAEQPGLPTAAPAAEQPIRTANPLDDLRRVIDSGTIDPAERDALAAILDRLRTKGLKKNPFTYFPPGDLVGGAGDGVKDMTDYAPNMVFPFDNAEAFVNSQIFGFGGGGWAGKGGGGGSELDARNYSYPWRDNFCEVRGWDVPICPSGKGHQGIDIRAGALSDAGTPKPTLGNDGKLARVVAVEDGTVTKTTLNVTVVLRSQDGKREWEYLNLCPGTIAVKPGDSVQAGALIGPIGNCMSGEKNMTTWHLHLNLRLIDGRGGRLVNPYMTLVRAYERKHGPGTMVSDTLVQPQQRADAAPQ